MASNGDDRMNIKPSTLENIDKSMFVYIDDLLNLHTKTNEGFTKVPVIWTGAERVYQVKHDVALRDSAGLLKLPLIVIERQSVQKDAGNRGPVPGNLPDIGNGGSVIIGRKINREKTSIHQSAYRRRKSGAGADVGTNQSHHPQTKFPKKIASMFDTRPVNLKDRTIYSTYYIPIPVYINVKYEITLQTEYQQQMNDLLAPFISSLTTIGRNHRYIKLFSEGHSYEGFVDGSFSMENNIASMQEDERKFITKISIDVLGYLVGGDKNEHSNIVKKYENIVDVKMPRERVVIDDEHEYTNKDGSDPFYKE